METARPMMIGMANLTCGSENRRLTRVTDVVRISEGRAMHAARDLGDADAYSRLISEAAANRNLLPRDTYVELRRLENRYGIETAGGP